MNPHCSKDVSRHVSVSFVTWRHAWRPVFFSSFANSKITKKLVAIALSSCNNGPLKKFIFILIFLLNLGHFSWAISPNDVSILLPLPTPVDFLNLLTPEDHGPEGALLYLPAFKKMNELVPEHENAVVWKNQLRVVALRLDPCFVEGVGPKPCRRQIRLVWQPIVFKNAKPEARDAAVHSFYEFDEVTFQKIKMDWFRVANGKASDELQIHPQILQEGWQGEYWQNLRRVILQYCGEKNLIRMTTMNVMGGEQMWIFAGFDIVNGEVIPMQVPRFFNKMSQGVISSSSANKGFTGGLMPAPEVDAEVGEFLEDSFSFKRNYSEEQVRAVIVKAKEYESPAKHNPGTLDCASCHMADSIHRWGKLNFPKWDWSEKTPSNGPLRTNQLRAFGYFMSWPVTSSRVVNETEEVVRGWGS